MKLKLNTLIIAAAILIISLFYDDLRLRLLMAKRRYNRLRKNIKPETKRVITRFYSKK